MEQAGELLLHHHFCERIWWLSSLALILAFVDSDNRVAGEGPIPMRTYTTGSTTVYVPGIA